MPSEWNKRGTDQEKFKEPSGDLVMLIREKMKLKT